MTFSSLVVAITLTISYTATSSIAIDDTFSVNLIHRDSVDSPFYDRSMSFAQRMVHALQRSFINVKQFRSNIKGSTYQADAIRDHGEFLLNISYGNPSQKVLAIADTGSDLSWMQCKPCTKCYKHTAPLFDPKNSSTYQPIDCESKTCKAMASVATNCSAMKECEFLSLYADGSVSTGTVSTETITLGDRVLPNIVFGCSFTNDGTFQPAWGGIVGLGGGDYSLVSQIRTLVPGKFSYCLIPYPLTNEFSNKSSKMTFGDFDFGPNVVTTPLVQKIPKTYYHVTFEGFSVGDKRISISDDLNSTKPLLKGNMIVDSGTTLTMLPPKLYDEFESAIKEAINVRTIKDPQKALNLCYRSAKVTKMPKVTMHFDGADVELSRDNVFVTVSKHIMCFGFLSSSDHAVMGNIAQLNHLIGFDLENNMLSFKSTDCERL
ncbi:putative nepenthesin [Helianthus annuus]|nr:putative nepenthesin [Helianthus annuus]